MALARWVIELRQVCVNFYGLAQAHIKQRCLGKGRRQKIQAVHLSGISGVHQAEVLPTYHLLRADMHFCVRVSAAWQSIPPAAPTLQPIMCDKSTAYTDRLISLKQGT